MTFESQTALLKIYSCSADETHRQAPVSVMKILNWYIWVRACVCACALGKNESWMQTNSPWLMKAAGPSQSWAQRLRVEYITLKSLTPALSTALSAGLSSAMQPSRTSTRSPANLGSNNSSVIHLQQKKNKTHSPGHAALTVQLRAALTKTMLRVWVITSASSRLSLLHWSLRSICHKTLSWHRYPTGRHWGSDTPADIIDGLDCVLKFKLQIQESVVAFYESNIYIY